MKKKITLLTCVVLCGLSVVTGAVASNAIRDIKAQLRQDFTIEIDGEIKAFRNAQGEIVYPMLYEGTTYLPVRAIGELMGKTVYWYEDEKRIALRDTTVTDADVIVVDSGQTAQPVHTAAPAPTGSIDQSSFIGVDKAKEIALEKAGLTTANVIFDRVELDRDDGVIHYEVEFRQGYVEYDADIKADDGTILKWEVDRD